MPCQASYLIAHDGTPQRPELKGTVGYLVCSLEPGHDGDHMCYMGHQEAWIWREGYVAWKVNVVTGATLSGRYPHQ